jgi:hypothetical protein
MKKKTVSKEKPRNRSLKNKGYVKYFIYLYGGAKRVKPTGEWPTQEPLRRLQPFLYRYRLIE